MRKIIEGLCAVIGVFVCTWLLLSLVSHVVNNGGGYLLLGAVPFVLGALVCLIGLLENCGMTEKIADIFADGKEDEV